MSILPDTKRKSAAPLGEGSHPLRVRPGRQLWRILIGSATGRIGLALLLLLVVVAAIAPLLLGAAARELDVLNARQGPSADHWLGTDELGRDVFARTLVATRLSLQMAATAAGIAAVCGGVGGLVLGTIKSARIRSVFLRVIDASLAFPALLVAVLVVSVLTPSAWGAVIAIGVAVIPQYARLVSTLVLGTAGRDYVDAARALGLSRFRLLQRHLLPNIAEPVIITTSVVVATSLIWLSALSFLGLGVQDPQFDWGTMLNEGLKVLYISPSAALAPAGAIVLAGVGFGLVGEGLSRAMNPVLWTSETTRDQGSRASSEAAGRVPASTSRVPASTVAYAGTVSEPALLVVKDLHVTISQDGPPLHAVRGVDFTVARGERVGVVGESGSGKSLTMSAVARLAPAAATVEAQELSWKGTDVRGLDHRRLRRTLGTDLAMVFQDPNAALNPALRVVTQLTESPRHHLGLSKNDARRRALDALRDVHISAPERRLTQYPHELSGGMRQRVTIAMGLTVEPELIIADEPTTALDVTVQGQILDVLRELNERYGTAIVFISHDIGVVAELCDRIMVMYAGRVIEDAPTQTLLRDPIHPYTKALLQTVPRLSAPRDEPLATIPGRPPSLDEPIVGCAYAPRCPERDERSTLQPPVHRIAANHRVACWLAEDR